MLAIPWLALVSVFAGVLVGIAAKTADLAPGNVLTDVASSVALYGLILVILGRQATTGTRAVIAATAAAVGLVISYYAFSAFVLHYGIVYLTAWLLIALVGVPLFALGAWWSTRPGAVVRGIVLGCFASAAFADGSAGLLPALYSDPIGVSSNPHIPLGVFELLCAVAMCLSARSLRNSLVALGVATILFFAAMPLLGLIYSSGFIG